MPNVSTSDLIAAEEWLRSYEAGPGEDASHFDRVADWIGSEIAKRREAAAVRQIVAETGVTPAQARKALREATKQ